MPMRMRRFPRLTNAFSKKVEHHVHAVALHTTYDNVVRTHGTRGSRLRWQPLSRIGLGRLRIPWRWPKLLRIARQARAVSEAKPGVR
jgi:hypothetical protein